MGTVFISYSHDSKEHSERVLALANRLREEGVDCLLDQYVTSPAEGWPKWMDRQLKKAEYIIIICTETYWNRVMGQETPGKGKGIKWESTLTYQYIYDSDSQNTRFIPVVFDPGDCQYIPTPLKGASYYCVKTPEGYDDLYRHLTKQPKVVKPERGAIRELLPEKVVDYFPSIAAPISRGKSRLGPLVLIKHNIYSSKWDNLTLPLLSWYMQEYWAVLEGDEQEPIPRFLVFFNVRYQYPGEPGFIRKILNRKSFSKERIREHLQQFTASAAGNCPCLLLRELTTVEREDVMDWFIEYNIFEFEADRKNRIDAIFRENDQPVSAISWAKAEMELARIVKEYGYQREEQLI